MAEKVVRTLNDLKEILSHISFAPSCVEMGWNWEVQNVNDGPDDQGDTHEFGYLLRTTFRRPDRDTGVISIGYGRWWHVGMNVSESGVVKTAYAAAGLILTHELMESFKYQGKRVFDPHNSVEDLMRVSDRNH